MAGEPVTERVFDERLLKGCGWAALSAFFAANLLFLGGNIATGQDPTWKLLLCPPNLYGLWGAGRRAFRMEEAA